MQTSAPNATAFARRAMPRADRIRRLINRIDGRLADLRFAENLGHEAAYTTSQSSDAITTACAHNLAVRALRAARLSRAELRALQTTAE